VIYYRGLKFPHRAVVLLALESDGACTGLNGYCARKSIVLYYDATMAGVIGSKICKVTNLLETALSNGVTNLQVMVALARSVSRWSVEVVTLLYLLPRPRSLTCRVNTQVLKCYDYHH